MNRNDGGRAAGKNQTRQTDDKSVKVKYISSPVMMEAKNPSQFKEIVQHFTGHNPNETTYDMYYPNYSTATTTTTTASAATTNTTSELFAYGDTHYTNNVTQVGIDGYSWEEIAEWNRNR
ncbi:hypothetical protein QVD17_36264 [Tagetes erecta]|uniref:VQ domain-containing protein n=1 Tax=Tagetes erecta TaxID=13708 RepID=A0AAD8JY86_TARER|nr:hypothetical protein QVD17_36264 [Tagetes erecta]